MKILEKNGKFEKVTNDFIAETKVKNHGWRYASKTEWRSANKSLPPIVTVTEDSVDKKINKSNRKIKK